MSKVKPAAFISFKRKKADGPLTGFKMSSSIEAAKADYEDNKEINESEEKPADAATDETEATPSPMAALCYALIDRFVDDLSKFHELISVIDFLRGGMTRVGVEQGILRLTKAHGSLIDNDPLNETYSLTTAGAEIVSEEVQRMNHLDGGLALLPSSILLSLVATFDSLIGDALREIIAIRPDKIQMSEKTITYREVFRMADIDAVKSEAIEDEIGQLLRDSHEAQVKYIERIIETDVSAHYERLPNFLEIFERRNQIAHAAGVATQRYVSRCKAIKFPLDGIEVGKPLRLTPKYLHNAVDVLLEFGITMSFVAWRKLAAAEESLAFDRMNNVAFSLLEKRRHKLASHLLDFTLHRQPKSGDETTRRMMVVNLANAQRALGKKEQSLATLSEMDWGACSDDFKICVAAVRGDVDEVCKLLPVAVASGKLTDSNAENWPAFDAVRDDVKFSVAFETTFKRPLKTKQASVETAQKASDAEQTNELSEAGTVH